MPRLHVAVLDEELPFPLNSGKRIRSFNLLTRLAKTHRITYIAHRNAEQNELNEATAALRDFDITPLIVERVVPPKSGIGFYARLLKNVFSPLPYSVASHASAAMRAAMDRLAQNDRPDLWHCEWTPYAQAMYRRQGPWVVMAHNVESLIWQRYAENESNPLKRWFLEKQWRRFERFRRLGVFERDANRRRQPRGCRSHRARFRRKERRGRRQRRRHRLFHGGRINRTRPESNAFSRQSRLAA